LFLLSLLKQAGSELLATVFRHGGPARNVFRAGQNAKVIGKIVGQ
jgi:hypothetical protein